MSYTAALIGGPQAGEVWTVRDSSPIRVMVAPEVDWSADPLELVEPEVVIYGPRTFSFFGLPMRVWCAPEFMGDANRNELIAQLGAHVLSPLGRTLLKEGSE